MINITNGICTMDNHDWEHILEWKEDYGLLESFKNELEFLGLDIKDVKRIRLKEFQEEYIDIHSRLILLLEYNY